MSDSSTAFVDQFLGYYCGKSGAVALFPGAAKDHDYIHMMTPCNGSYRVREISQAAQKALKNKIL
jgi:hypothetical protein